MDPTTDPRQRFSNTVDDYRRYRPRYPRGLCDHLASHVGLSPGQRIVDLGAGTGILSEDLLDFGAQAIAVEPNEAMRNAAEEHLGARQGFFSVAGSAESTTLPSDTVDGVIAGQAFHWFDPRATRTELMRVGTPDLWVAIVWNTRRVERTPFLIAYEQLCRRFGTDYSKVAATYSDAAALAVFFGDGQFERTQLENAQVLDRAGLHGRLRSCSYIPRPGAPNYDELTRAIDACFDEHQRDATVTIEYDTDIYCARLR